MGWAAASVLSPSDEVLASPGFTTVQVVQGEVGSSITLNTVAAWTPIPVGVNRAVGVVTSVTVAAGDEVSQGSTLYAVDLRPVVVAMGETPAFRDIGQGVEGPDVAQLQAMLTSLGLFRGAVDGKAGAGTVAATKAWQKSLGLPQSGVVGVGDVIFVPVLPTRVALDDEIVTRGATLSGGEDLVAGLPASPVFTVPVTEGQAGMMPTGTRVEITSPDGDVWVAVAGEQTPDPETGTITVALTGVDGGVICGEQCGQVPVTGQALLSSRIVTVPTVTGLVVPSAALVTGADGQTAVVTEDGDRIPVSVVASARGMSVVEGVEQGARVRVPAT
ncbi:peptidoglycan-binding protein [Microbacterium sp. NEAU-LLC]|uniref:Peptidoglycan-binding protein n=1 Tax=Microbacterium helvum TaxID=2773713 RepID=A0ABR8NKX6_9MICO|nr:peptidoglycan-binding protein [Microbacterium helvum]